MKCLLYSLRQQIKSVCQNHHFILNCFPRLMSCHATTKKLYLLTVIIAQKNFTNINLVGKIHSCVCFFFSHNFTTRRKKKKKYAQKTKCRILITSKLPSSFYIYNIIVCWCQCGKCVFVVSLSLYIYNILSQVYKRSTTTTTTPMNRIVLLQSHTTKKKKLRGVIATPPSPNSKLATIWTHPKNRISNKKLFLVYIYGRLTLIFINFNKFSSFVELVCDFFS